MIQTLERTFLIGYDNGDVNPFGRLDADNAVLASGAAAYFEEHPEIEHREPVILYTPEPAAALIAERVSSVFRAFDPVVVASPHILTQDLEIPSGPLAVDTWLNGNPNGFNRYDDPLTIVITRSDFVRRVTGDDRFTWLYKDVEPLPPVLQYTEAAAKEFVEHPMSGGALTTTTADHIALSAKILVAEIEAAGREAATPVAEQPAESVSMEQLDWVFAAA